MNKFLKMIAILAVFFSFCVFTTCSVVGPGQKAIITHFGAIQPEILGSGAYFKIPIVRGLQKFDLRVHKDAQAEVNRARGQAEAQRLLKTSITQEILQKMAIEKWDGQFPQVMGSGTIPFLNLTLPKKNE